MMAIMRVSSNREGQLPWMAESTRRVVMAGYNTVQHSTEIPNTYMSRSYPGRRYMTHNSSSSSSLPLRTMYSRIQPVTRLVGPVTLGQVMKQSPTPTIGLPHQDRAAGFWTNKETELWALGMKMERRHNDIWPLTRASRA